MKKAVKGFLFGMTAIVTVLMPMATGAAEESANEFDAEANAAAWIEFDKNDAIHYFNSPAFGKIDGYDFDTFIHSELSVKILERMQRWSAYPDEMDPEVVKYWAEQGLVKAMNDADDPDRTWASYVPVSVNNAQETDRTYPVLFVLHGGGNPIYMTEDYGYIDLAAEEELIVAAPWAGSNEIIVEEIPRILEELRSKYPIDESRIYCAGFSQGGMSSAILAAHYPELFAAVAPGGIRVSHYCGSVDGNISEALYIPKDSELWNKDVEIPIINLSGMYDQAPVETGNTDVFAYNHFMKVNGCKELTDEAIEAAMVSEDIVEQAGGMLFDKTETKVLDGTNYYIGDLVNEEEIPMFRMVRIEGLGHWPSGSLAYVAWEYMSQFSRNPETGELIINS